MFTKKITTQKPFTLYPKPDVLLDKAQGGFSMDLVQLNEFQQELQAYSTKVDQAILHAKALDVATEQDAKDAVELAGQMRRLSKKIDATRKEITAPARDFVSRVNGMAADFTDRLETAVNMLATKEGAFRESERKRQEDEAAEMAIIARATGVAVDVVAVEEPVKARTNATSASTYSDTVTEIEVIDMEKVPRQFLILDEAAVKVAVKAGKTEIPGLKIVQKKVTRIRAK